MLTCAVLLLLLAPCWTARLRFTVSGNLSLSPRPIPAEQGLDPRHVHSWRINKASTCSGPLVVEFWEERLTAAAAPPLVDNLVLCPLLSTLDYPTLVADPRAGSRYTQWEALVGKPWSQDAYAIGGLWWDHEAAARQLPYHRTQVKSSKAAPAAADTWWVHVVNRRGTAVPKYHIRATCAASVPCPEPLLGEGPCSGQGTCRAVQGTDGLGYSNQTTACDCEAGKGGLGCEVDVPRLSLGTPTTVVPTYNTDMKLIWNAAINTSWSLYTVKAPKSSDLVVELSVDWGTAPVLLAAANLPRLCVATGVEAFHAGRLLPYQMDCRAPVNFPLGFATGATYDMSQASGTNQVQILVMDVGTYPVQLTARASTGNNGDTCPFSCSQQPSKCRASGGCSCPAAGLGGQLCQYIYYTDASPQFDFDLTNYLLAKAESPSIQLAPGQSAWWVLQLPSRPPGSYFVNSKGHPMRVRWDAGQGTPPGAMQGLNASAYQMELYGDSATRHKDPAPAVECWQTNETPYYFRDVCFVSAPENMVGLHITNDNQEPVTFTVFMEGYSSSGSSSSPSGQYGASPVDYSRGALAAFGVLVVCSGAAFLYRFWVARRLMRAALAARALHDPEAATGGAAQRQAAAKYGVPKGVIDTFPTEIYAPPAPAAAPSMASVQRSMDTSNTPDQQGASWLADKPSTSLPGADVELASFNRQASAPMLEKDSQGAVASDADSRSRDGASGSAGLRRASSAGRETMLGGALRRLGSAFSGIQPAATPDRPTDGADLSCTICLDEYEAGDVLRRLPCLHTFHQPCIDAWMDSNHTCPVCRQHLVEAPTARNSAAPAAQQPAW